MPADDGVALGVAARQHDAPDFLPVAGGLQRLRRPRQQPQGRSVAGRFDRCNRRLAQLTGRRRPTVLLQAEDRIYCADLQHADVAGQQRQPGQLDVGGKILSAPVGGMPGSASVAHDSRVVCATPIPRWWFDF